MPFVRECIHSILAQTHTHYQLIVLDNCSTDGTREYLSQIRDARLTVHSIPQFVSMETNWARIGGLSMSPDTYVTLIGHDDILFPNFLATIDSLVEQNPTASLYQTLFELIDVRGQRIRGCSPIAERESATDFLHQRIAGQRDSFGTGYVFRFGDYCQCGGIPAYPSLLWADDMLWIRLSRRTYKACAQRICFAYRSHPSSESYRMSRNRPLIFTSLTAYTRDLHTTFSQELDNPYTQNTLVGWLLDRCITGVPVWLDAQDTVKARGLLTDTLLDCFPNHELTIRNALKSSQEITMHSVWRAIVSFLRAITPPCLYAACARRAPRLLSYLARNDSPAASSPASTEVP